MAKLIKKIQNFAFRHQLWKENAKIIVGVSGGADSVCLLDVLVKLAPKYNFSLHIAHINYGLRDQDSDKDEKFVKNLAEKYGLTFDLLKFPRYSLRQKFKSEGKNLENALRQIRYGFFEKVRMKKKFDLIAVAHNQDDQAETILMRLIRGSGLQGLAAMRAKSHMAGNQKRTGSKRKKEGEKNRATIIRPLLNTSRKEILEYNRKNKLQYQTDITNKDIRIFRNKIRHRLLPYLKNYNPNIEKVLADTAVLIADDYSYLDGNARQILKRINIEIKTPLKKGMIGGKINFDIKKIQKLHPAMQRQILRQIISRLKLDLTDVESAHIEEILKIIQSAKGKKQTAKFKELKVERKGDIVYINNLNI